jgi:hypothetical protein
VDRICASSNEPETYDLQRARDPCSLRRAPCRLAMAIDLSRRAVACAGTPSKNPTKGIVQSNSPRP